jgi:hypothetical protein
MYQLIQDLLKRPIAFHRVFAGIMGCAAGGLFLSQLYYWSTDRKAHDPDNFIYKTLEDWQSETAISRREWEKARARLKSAGLLEEQRRGLNPQLWYKLDIDLLYETIVKSSQNPHDSGIATSDISQRKIERQLPLDPPSPDAISDLRSISTESTDQKLPPEITHTDPDRVCENFEPEILLPDLEPSQDPITLPAVKESASTNNSPSEGDLPPPVTNISEVVGIPDCDLSSVARFDRTLRTYQPTEDLTAQLVETYNKVKPDHWGKCLQIGTHMPRQVAALVRSYESPELVAQEWGEACLALKANDFYNSPKFQSGNINFLLDPSKPDRIPQLAQAWRDRPQQQKEQLAHKMVAASNGIPRWENPDVVLTGAMLHLRRDRYARYVTREDFDNPDCPSINYLQTYFPELFTKNA